MVKDPIYKKDCWECPECGWLNPYSNMLLLSNPPMTYYNCNNCKYRYSYVQQIPPSDIFRSRYPYGRPKTKD